VKFHGVRQKSLQQLDTYFEFKELDCAIYWTASEAKWGMLGQMLPLRKPRGFTNMSIPLIEWLKRAV
jgi:hypothetical protein